MWTTAMRSTDDTVCDRLPKLSMSDEVHAAAIRLLKLAFEKASTSPENQRIFWGTPRAAQPDYSTHR